ncbi:protein of unknown function [Taphrina deformans PYCC 5710]|uniref:Glycosyl transferase family protein n=1 Tax=Taphrina deformans (strain PYCC 5710 / ATCC 11124 / CBS 356.35 / IMI 108563 / JCM 9778 / NBRC 8474) TaxID=1097556 RepID=R4XEB1_TAPDE|nr:protein of unknown function [Taphrina deformans PYCC 5710]|eukprot:CCG84157.1 protein of unknown function [Taphrina deformans PYCC 5710]
MGAEWVLGVPNPDIHTETDVTLEVQSSGTSQEPYDGAWVTLLTKQTYLPGLIILNDSLLKVRSQFPLLVLYTASLEPEALETMAKLGIEHRFCEYIHPPAHISHIAPRFVDTWTKLRICEVEGFRRVVMIDNDMLVLQNMDELFHMTLGDDQIAANHGCICNLDDSAWAPAWFTRDNCPYTGQSHPSSLTHPAPTGAALGPGHRQLNSGLVVLRPSPALKARIEAYIAHPPPDQTFQFPDQDVLVGLYGHEWRSLSWTYNAVKISREWHADMWSDRGMKNLHYICDKPWEKRPDGQDFYLHYCWWDQWDKWIAQHGDSEPQMARYLGTLVAQQ